VSDPGAGHPRRVVVRPGTLDIKSQLYLTAALRNDGSSTFGRSNLRSWFPKGAWRGNSRRPPGPRRGCRTARPGWRTVKPARSRCPISHRRRSRKLCWERASHRERQHADAERARGMVTRSELKAASTLKPERSKEFEAGVDLGFLRDRADASITWYNKKIHRCDLPEPLPVSTGYFAQGSNARPSRPRLGDIAEPPPIQRADYGWEVGCSGPGTATKCFRSARSSSSRSATSTTRSRWSQPIALYLGAASLPVRRFQRYDEHRRRGGGGTDSLGPCVRATRGRAVRGPERLPAAGSGSASRTRPELQLDRQYPLRVPVPQAPDLRLARHPDGGQIWNARGALWSYGTHKDTEQARRLYRAHRTGCTGNTKIFGQAAGMMARRGPVPACRRRSASIGTATSWDARSSARRAVHRGRRLRKTARVSIT